MQFLGIDFQKLLLTVDGRIGRQTFWIGFAALFVAGMINGLIIGSISLILATLVSLALAVPAYCVSIKRSNDRGHPQVYVQGFFIASIAFQVLTLIGVFGFLGYDMVRHMERLPAAKVDPIGVPDALMIRPTILLVFDAVKDEIVIVTPVFPKASQSPRAAYEAANDRLNTAIDALEAPLRHPGGPDDLAARLPEAQSNTTPAEYEAMVARAKEYILAGDIFQVVLSQRFSCPFDLDAFSLYRALRRVNPSPYLCYLDFAGFQIVCSSPEILVKVANEEKGARKVTIRPIAGTRKRGATPAEDKALEEELLDDFKERAEHLMLLDLGRNDVGRVAEIGSVKVTDSFFVERYSQVMHIVSNVEGLLDPQYDVIDALAAGFPAGTVSGAPKIRAMELIAEIEPTPRAAYCGSIGYLGFDGSADLNILIRTVTDTGGWWTFPVGGGIVVQSDPRKELDETWQKARGMLQAVLA
ncbi:MAG TPA: anthranilate synthase component I [Planctomycetaceae bacterium]|nr:anthranilate synthase component I [Planctomycetaceae bacterium]